MLFSCTLCGSAFQLYNCLLCWFLPHSKCGTTVLVYIVVLLVLWYEWGGNKLFIAICYFHPIHPIKIKCKQTQWCHIDCEAKTSATGSISHNCTLAMQVTRMKDMYDVNFFSDHPPTLHSTSVDAHYLRNSLRNDFSLSIHIYCMSNWCSYLMYATCSFFFFPFSAMCKFKY